MDRVENTNKHVHTQYLRPLDCISQHIIYGVLATVMKVVDVVTCAF
jgi:hypothetical protein